MNNACQCEYPYKSDCSGTSFLIIKHNKDDDIFYISDLLAICTSVEQKDCRGEVELLNIAPGAGAADVWLIGASRRIQ